jgi:hypothetical protein
MSTTHRTEIDGDATVIEVTVIETRTTTIRINAYHLDDLHESRRGITAKGIETAAKEEATWTDPGRIEIHAHVDDTLLAQAIAGHAAWNAQFAEDED